MNTKCPIITHKHVISNSITTKNINIAANTANDETRITNAIQNTLVGLFKRIASDKSSNNRILARNKNVNSKFPSDGAPSIWKPNLDPSLSTQKM